jgi:hypothetical protein
MRESEGRRPQDANAVIAAINRRVRSVRSRLEANSPALDLLDLVERGEEIMIARHEKQLRAHA